VVHGSDQIASGAKPRHEFDFLFAAPVTAQLADIERAKDKGFFPAALRHAIFAGSIVQLFLNLAPLSNGEMASHFALQVISSRPMDTIAGIEERIHPIGELRSRFRNGLSNSARVLSYGQGPDLN